MNDLDLGQLEADAQAAKTEVPNDDSLKSVAELAARQLELEDRVTLLTAELKQEQERLENVSTNLIPAAMAQMQMTEFTLANGYRLELKQFYNGSIPEGQQEKFFAWLRENGHEGIIKNFISIELGKGQDNMSKAVLASLKELEITPEVKTGVHSMTLKSWIREAAEAGDLPPPELLKVFIGQKAKLSPTAKVARAGRGKR